MLNNFKAGVQEASLAIVIDNSEDNMDEQGGAYQAIALYVEGQLVDVVANPPAWWQTCIPIKEAEADDGTRIVGPFGTAREKP